MALITRIRLVDVPPREGRQGSHVDELKQLINNIKAGIGPMEALELNSQYNTMGGGQYLAGVVRKELVRNKIDTVDVLVRKGADGKVKVYVVGR